MSDTKNPMVDYQDRPLTDDEKLYLHQWSRDDLIEINERIFNQSEAHDKGEPIDVKKALDDAGIELPESPPEPTYVGAQGGVRQARDHPLTGVVDDAPVDDDATADDWDDKDVQAEVDEMKVDELKEYLRELGEPVSGNQKELQDRLFKALKKQHESE